MSPPATLVPDGGADLPLQSLRPAEPDPQAPSLGWSGLVPLEAAYAKGDLLGQGGVGQVIAGRHRVLDRPVAIKSVRPERRGASANHALLREAAATAAVAHPQVVAVHDVAVDEDGHPHVIMEQVSGRTWLDYLIDPAQITADFGASDPLAWHVGVLDRVCRAVHHAHSLGVLHRDLKPDNVMVGLHGEVTVVDWGLAVRTRSEGPRRVPLAAHDHRVVGTPRFMAPEMAAARPDQLGPPTDVYLLGGLLYAVLTGRAPHPGATVKETLAAVPTFRPTFPPHAPTRLATLVRQCMAPSPSDRLQSAEALRRGLQAWTETRAADALVEEAERLTAELAVELASTTQAHSTLDRHRIYRRFGAARFGFEQALATRSDHTEARAGRDRVLRVLARYELDCDDPRTAALHIADLSSPDTALLDALARTEARHTARRSAEAAARAQADPRTRVRTRLFVFSVCLLTWTALPVLPVIANRSISWAQLVLTHAGMLGLLGVLVVWAEDSLSRSKLNQGVVHLLAVVHGALLVGDLGGYLSSMTPHTVFWWHHLGFAIAAALSVRLLGVAAWIPTLAYSTVFLAGATQGEHPTLVGSALANLLTAATAAWMWRPTDLGALWDRDRGDWSR